MGLNLSGAGERIPEPVMEVGRSLGRCAIPLGLIMIILLVGGFFRFLMRRILIGASRHIEYDLRNGERIGYGRELITLEPDSLFLPAFNRVVVR